MSLGKNLNPQYLYLCLIVLLSLESCSTDSNFDDPVNQINDFPEIETGRLPMFLINTFGQEVPDEPKIPAKLDVFLEGENIFDGHIGIETRGASSQGYPKKQYGIETWDASGEDIDVELLGYPLEEDWIINGPYADKSLMRNKFIYDLSREMGRYASRAEFVEMKLNGLHKGTHVLLEKIKRDSERVDISKLKSDDNSGEEITGGYILKIDKGIGGNFDYNNFMSWKSDHAPWHDTSGQPIRFQYVYPKYDEISSDQTNYIQGYMRDFENALASDNFTDPENGYRAYIDVDSFIDFFILNELSNNVDGFRLSTYMHKKKSDKLYMGPIWDFNFAFGNADYCDGGAHDVWAYRFNERCGGDGWSIPFWWERLMEDPYFIKKLKGRWSALRGSTLSDMNLANYLDLYHNHLSETRAIELNFTIWNILGQYVWPNKYIGGTYENEFNYLKSWTLDRADWLDAAISDL